MSRENVEIVRRSYESLNRRDIEAWIEVFHPDVEMHDVAGIPDAPVRRGHDALREWVAMMEDIWTDACYEPEEFTDAGKFVLVAVHAKARGARGGVPLDVPMFHAFEMEDERIRRLWAYLDRAEALKAVGLEE
jgi:ketosteroid isomerase-like protein